MERLCALGAPSPRFSVIAKRQVTAEPAIWAAGSSLSLRDWLPCREVFCHKPSLQLTLELRAMAFPCPSSESGSWLRAGWLSHGPEAAGVLRAFLQAAAGSGRLDAILIQLPTRNLPPSCPHHPLAALSGSDCRACQERSPRDATALGILLPRQQLLRFSGCEMNISLP